MTEKLGDYELIQHIATGGMAEIFLARLSSLGGFSRTLVVKRMLPQLAAREEFVKMFLDEARLAAQLHHPNIAQVLNLGKSDGHYFMAMELVDGPHLGALFARSLRKRKPLPLPLCAYICARAADGLHFAHELCDPHSGHNLHIVHRDISPQNILVSRYGDVKVTDFGVAKADSQSTMTRTGVIKGKVSYMSPEQCLGEKVDRRTDVFALGIVLYEMLTRRRLYREKSDLLVMQKITEYDVPPASEENPRVEPELDAICAKALAKDRDERFSSTLELSAALEQWLAGQQELESRAKLGHWIDAHAPDLSFELDTQLSTPGLATAQIDSGDTENTVATPALGSRAEHASLPTVQQAASEQMDSLDEEEDQTAHISEMMSEVVGDEDRIERGSETLVEDPDDGERQDAEKISLVESEVPDESSMNVLSSPVDSEGDALQDSLSRPKQRAPNKMAAMIGAILILGGLGFVFTLSPNDSTSKLPLPYNGTVENAGGDINPAVEGEKPSARFSLTTVPAQAKIQIAGQGGKTKELTAPLSEYVLASQQTYRVTVTHPGYQQEVIELLLEEDEHWMQDVTLKRESSAGDTKNSNSRSQAAATPTDQGDQRSATASTQTKSDQASKTTTPGSAPADRGASTAQKKTVAASSTETSNTKTGGSAATAEKSRTTSTKSSGVTKSHKAATSSKKSAQKSARAKAASKKATKKEPVRKKKGQLTVFSRPWVEVWVNGRKRGISPLQKQSLPAGKARLRFSNQKLGINEAWNVTIPSNGVYTLKLVFEKKNGKYVIKSKKGNVSN